MTNILFCYWLQGYFEISKQPSLVTYRIKLIEDNLGKISEPLWNEMQWLKNVCDYFHKVDYAPETLNYFMPLIQQCLNSVFYHYIDNDKDKEYSLEELDLLHQGLAHEAK